jgi:hypothetical protein
LADHAKTRSSINIIGINRHDAKNAKDFFPIAKKNPWRPDLELGHLCALAVSGLLAYLR